MATINQLNNRLLLPTIVDGVAGASLQYKNGSGILSGVALSTQAGKLVRVNAGGDGLEFIDRVFVNTPINVANKAARLALADDGTNYLALEADTGETWALISGGDPSVEADWIQIGDTEITLADLPALAGQSIPIVTSADPGGNVQSASNDYRVAAYTAQVVYELPAAPVSGATVEFYAGTASGFRVIFETGENAQLGSSALTGLDGGTIFVESTAIGDYLKLKYANSKWLMVGVVGNLNDSN